MLGVKVPCWVNSCETADGLFSKSEANVEASKSIWPVLASIERPGRASGGSGVDGCRGADGLPDDGQDLLGETLQGEVAVQGPGGVGGFVVGGVSRDGLQNGIGCGDEGLDEARCRLAIRAEQRL